MKKTILITGANGLLAKYLGKMLNDAYNLRFLTQGKTTDNRFHWNPEKQYIASGALNGVSSIIHLAGAPIADKRWTKKRKREILSGRVDAANFLLQECKQKNKNLDIFISASAIGYYGSVTSEKVFHENDDSGNDFLSEVCKLWEESAQDFVHHKIAERAVSLRLGIILSPDGGALPKLLTQCKFGLSSALGSGEQYMPWIHIRDAASIFKFLLENPHSGAFNAVAPNFVTNKQFVAALARALHKPYFLPNVPSVILRLLLGERADILLKGSRISSQKISEAGFSFEFKEISSALQSFVGKT